MIKVRIQGTKKELKSFLKYLRNSPKWQIENKSDFLTNIGTDKHYRVFLNLFKVDPSERKEPGKDGKVNEHSEKSRM